MKVNTKEMLDLLPLMQVKGFDGEYLVSRDIFANYTTTITQIATEDDFIEEVKVAANHIETLLGVSKSDADIIAMDIAISLNSVVLVPSRKFRVYRDILRVVGLTENESFNTEQFKLTLIDTYDKDLTSIITDGLLREELSEPQAVEVMTNLLNQIKSVNVFEGQVQM